MNRLIIILVVLVVIVMLFLVYAVGGFDWMFGRVQSLTDSAQNMSIDILKSTR